jgi:hypothetical protein
MFPEAAQVALSHIAECAKDFREEVPGFAGTIEVSVSSDLSREPKVNVIGMDVLKGKK